MKCVAIALALLGCKRDDKVDTGFTGKVEPPGGLRVGMTTDEAHTALPALTTADQPQAKINSKVILLVTFRTGRLREAIAMFDAANGVPEQQVIDAFQPTWGTPAPIHSTNPLAQVEWKSDATGWRADLECPPAGAQIGCTAIRFLPYRPLTAEYFGTACARPKALAPLEIGTPLDAAKRAFPELTDPHPMGDEGLSLAHVDAGADGTYGNVWFDTKNTIALLEVDTPVAADTQAMLAKAWGTPKTTTDAHGKLVLTWTSGTWRCELQRTERHQGTVVIEGGLLAFSRATP